VSGTSDPFGYYGYFHHRQSQGFREANSQYEVFYGGGKFTYEQAPDSKWTAAFDLYDESHGEPGGLTRAAFDSGSTDSTLLMDNFELERYAGSLAYEREISPETLVEAKAFGGYYSRYSERQRGGGFGTVPTGAAASTNDIQLQEFFTGGAEVRGRHEYAGLLAPENVLAGGILYYHSASPRRDKRGTAPDASDGMIRTEADRMMNYLSLFGENTFRWGDLAVTPGVRLENIWQDVEETTNLAKTAVPLADESEYDFVPLLGIGAVYDLPHRIEAYSNFSQGYRPKLFTQFVPTGTNEVVNGDLEEGESWQVDVGLRGKPAPYVFWDASWFYMEFEDQIGNVAGTVQNVGDAEHTGVETALEFDATAWWDAVAGTDFSKTVGSVKPFVNAMVLHAEFVAGPTDGRTPQYAPDFVIRNGIEYAWNDRVKVRLAGTFVDDHFGDDSNSASRVIPSYKVWDLTAEAKVYKDTVSVFGGINNLFDGAYFARVTGAGIDPADGVNGYGGVKVIW
jgi:Fe(3+) dicitrate transport protein